MLSVDFDALADGIRERLRVAPHFGASRICARSIRALAVKI
jgi:hypothetical protein